MLSYVFSRVETMKGVSLNHSELKELIGLISEKNITEFELEEQGVKLKIKKGRIPEGISDMAPPREGPAFAVPATGAEKSATSSTPQEDLSVVVIPSPMVGTFYRAPQPGAQPFVSEGERVKVGQVVCILEAMKVMNEIESEIAGEVTKIIVENGRPVQYGDELFHIRESK